MKGDEQICWSCNKAYGNGCCWFQKNEPVPNWKATQTFIKATADTGHKYLVPSYKIYKCPLYKCDNPIEELSTNVIAKVINKQPQLVRMWKINGKLKEYFNNNKRKLKKLENYYVNKF